MSLQIALIKELKENCPDLVSRAKEIKVWANSDESGISLKFPTVYNPETGKRHDEFDDSEILDSYVNRRTVSKKILSGNLLPDDELQPVGHGGSLKGSCKNNTSTSAGRKKPEEVVTIYKPCSSLEQAKRICAQRIAATGKFHDWRMIKTGAGPMDNHNYSLEDRMKWYDTTVSSHGVKFHNAYPDLPVLYFVLSEDDLEDARNITRASYIYYVYNHIPGFSPKRPRKKEFYVGSSVWDDSKTCYFAAHTKYASKQWQAAVTMMTSESFNKELNCNYQDNDKILYPVVERD